MIMFADCTTELSTYTFVCIKFLIKVLEDKIFAIHTLVKTDSAKVTLQNI